MRIMKYQFLTGTNSGKGMEDIYSAEATEEETK